MNPAGQEVEEPHSREESNNQTQGDVSSHIEDAATHAAHKRSENQSVFTASRRGSSPDNDVWNETKASEKFTTLPEGERRELKREEINVLVKAAFGATMLNPTEAQENHHGVRDVKK